MRDWTPTDYRLMPMLSNTLSAYYLFFLCSILPSVLYADSRERDDDQTNITIPHRTEKGPAPQEQAPHIPAVIDRPFSTEEGPFVQVKAFQLLEVEDIPSSDIKLSEIHALLEQMIQTQAEQGLSIGQLQEVANEVTRYYRQRGLILAKVNLPVQTVTDGIIKLELLIGHLGRILVQNNEAYDEKVLRRPFEHLLDQPVTKKGIESALLTLSDFPGLTMFGVFQPGQVVGTTDLLLNIQEESTYDISLRIDNHGISETGINRAQTTIAWNNITGGVDKLSLTVQQNYNPQNTNFLSTEYRRYLGKGFSTGISLYRNFFEVSAGPNQPTVESNNREGRLFLEKFFLRSREKNLLSTLSLIRRSASVTLDPSGLQSSRDDVFVAALDTAYDSVDTFHPLRPLYAWLFDTKRRFGGGVNLAVFEIRHGFNDLFGAMGSSSSAFSLPTNSQPSRQGRVGTEFEYASGQFNRIYASFSRLQLLEENQSLLLRGEFQQSLDILVPSEQYSIGGPNNVRAFPQAQGLFDRAVFLSVEYIINAPFFADRPAFFNRSWGELLQFSIFYDFASGLRNAPLEDGSILEQGHWITYRGYGLSLRFNLLGTLDSKLVWAKPLGNNSETPPNDGEARQLSFNLDLTF